MKIADDLEKEGRKLLLAASILRGQKSTSSTTRKVIKKA